MNTQSMARVDALLRDARTRIDAGEAELLLAHALETSRTWLFAHADAAVDAGRAGRYRKLVARRADGEPVAYLTGMRAFWTLDLAVDAGVLIPRPETERLVELALERLPGDCSLRIADLGTGSGAIALALASERPAARIVAVDASQDALDVARANAARLGAVNVDFRHGHWCEPLGQERFDLVASNPPYIAQCDPYLQQGDLRHEPALALASGTDGLDAIRIIVSCALQCLHPNGWLLLEHGWQQGEAVRALLEQAGYVEVATETDLEGRERVTLGRRVRG